MAIDTLTFSLAMGRSWTAQKNLTGGLNPITQSGRIDATVALGTAAANAAAGGANVLVQDVVDVPAGGTLTVDLQALTDILQGSANLARFKLFIFELLSTAQGGNACSGVTIGNAGTNPHQLDMGADTHTRVLGNGEGTAWWTTAAAGKTVDGTNKSVLVTNNDGAVVGKLRRTILGGTT